MRWRADEGSVVGARSAAGVERSIVMGRDVSLEGTESANSKHMSVALWNVSLQYRGGICPPQRANLL